MTTFRKTTDLLRYLLMFTEVALKLAVDFRTQNKVCSREQIQMFKFENLSNKISRISANNVDKELQTSKFGFHYAYERSQKHCVLAMVGGFFKRYYQFGKGLNGLVDIQHPVFAFWIRTRLLFKWKSWIACNGKLWYSNINRFCYFDMFRNFVKNSNPMCDVALSMWLLFSLFPRNWQVLRQQRARTSKNTGAPPWQKPETARTSENRLFWGANTGFIDFQHYATLCSGNRKNESFRLKILVWCLELPRPSFLAVLFAIFVPVFMYFQWFWLYSVALALV